jgi:hypothetical protein
MRFLIFFLLVQAQAYGQTPAWMREQIRSVGQFIDRYNTAQRPDSTATGTLRDLFNEDDPRLQLRAGLPLYRQQVEQFLEEARQAPAPLPDPPRVFAQTDLLVHLTGTNVPRVNSPDTLRLYLCKHYTPDRTTFWQLLGAAPLRGLRTHAHVPTHTNVPGHETAAADSVATRTPRWLPPNAHEVAFLPLLRGLSEARSLRHFMADTARLLPHEAAIEAALLTGQLHLDGALHTLIYLDTGRNWLLKLGEFIREKPNSGWLITDLYEPGTYALLPPRLRFALPH